MTKRKRTKKPAKKAPPKYRSEIYRNKAARENRLLVCVPTIGNVRMEWAVARYGQIIPTNWSHVEIMQFIQEHAPMGYMVADARNICCREVVAKNMEWLLFIDDDVILPPDAFIKINQYIMSKEYPVISGLYFTKSVPPEPLIYRGRGEGFYPDWKLGEKVWVDGVPMGCTLIHGDLIRKMWEESEEYVVGVDILHRIFETPAMVWQDPDNAAISRGLVGTEDLQWCTRVMEEGYLERSGWEAHAKKHPEWPFLLDTSIFCQHIAPNGAKYPGEGYSWDHGAQQKVS